MRAERDATLSLTLIELTSCTSLLDELRSVHVNDSMRLVRNRMDVFVAPLSGAGSWRRAPLTSAVAPQRARMETVLASNSAKTAMVTHDSATKKMPYRDLHRLADEWPIFCQCPQPLRENTA